VNPFFAALMEKDRRRYKINLSNLNNSINFSSFSAALAKAYPNASPNFLPCIFS